MVTTKVCVCVCVCLSTAVKKPVMQDYLVIYLALDPIGKLK